MIYFNVYSNSKVEVSNIVDTSNSMNFTITLQTLCSDGSKVFVHRRDLPDFNSVIEVIKCIIVISKSIKCNTYHEERLIFSIIALLLENPIKLV